MFQQCCYPVSLSLQYQSIKMAFMLRDMYLHVHRSITMWFQHQQCRYPNSISLIVYQLIGRQYGEDTLTILERGLLTFALLPLMIEQQYQVMHDMYNYNLTCDVTPLPQSSTLRQDNLLQPYEMCSSYIRDLYTLMKYLQKTFNAFKAALTFSIESVNVFGNKNVIQFPDMTPSFHSLWKLTEYFHNISLIGFSTTPITFNIITLIDVIKCIMYVL